MKNKAIYLGIGILIIGIVALVFTPKSANTEIANPRKETVSEISEVDSLKVVNKPKEEVTKKTTEKKEKTASQTDSDIMKNVLKRSK